MPENYSEAMLVRCIQECGRLANQDYFKADDAILEDLAKTLARFADSEEHASKMISLWKLRTRKMLHESDIPALAEDAADRGTLPKGCGACLGTDFIVIEKNGASGVKRCICARGRRLAKLDETHEQQSRRDVERSIMGDPIAEKESGKASNEDMPGGNWKH